MIQHFGSNTSQVLFMTDLQAMIDGRYNHPCIVQWDIFNEGDCVGSFNASAVALWAQKYDPSRLVDTNSGGPANDLHVADVNDIHDCECPWGMFGSSS
jgi:beta-galactosidase/beta-glucuronidase